MCPQLHVQLETKKSGNDSYSVASEPRNPEFKKAQTSSDGQDPKLPSHQSALALKSSWEGSWQYNLWVQTTPVQNHSLCGVWIGFMDQFGRPPDVSTPLLMYQQMQPEIIAVVGSFEFWYD